jgi:hypothetical protein
MLSPLYCVVKLRYALSASSIESSDSQDLETISWSSIRPLIEDYAQGSDYRSHRHLGPAPWKGRCWSAGLAGQGVKGSPFQNCWGSETSGSISHRARSGSSGVVSQGTHPVLLFRGRERLEMRNVVWC